MFLSCRHGWTKKLKKWRVLHIYRKKNTFMILQKNILGSTAHDMGHRNVTLYFMNTSRERENGTGSTTTLFKTLKNFLKVANQVPCTQNDGCKFARKKVHKRRKEASLKM
jgi:hypothetical protein